MKLAVTVYGGLLLCVALLMVAGEAIGPNFREFVRRTPRKNVRGDCSSVHRVFVVVHIPRQGLAACEPWASGCFFILSLVSHGVCMTDAARRDFLTFCMASGIFRFEDPDVRDSISGAIPGEGLRSMEIEPTSSSSFLTPTGSKSLSRFTIVQRRLPSFPPILPAKRELTP